jgi:hypothetical protein
MEEGALSVVLWKFFGEDEALWRLDCEIVPGSGRRRVPCLHGLEARICEVLDARSDLVEQRVLSPLDALHVVLGNRVQT